MALRLPSQPIYRPKRELDADLLQRYWHSVEEETLHISGHQPSSATKARASEQWLGSQYVGMSGT
jgi:hypothetical protein